MIQLKDKHYYTIFFVFCLVYLCFEYNRFLLDKDTIENGVVTSVEIQKKFCGQIRRQSVHFTYQGGFYSIDVGDSVCEKYQIGDAMQLIYSKKHDLFLKPDKSLALRDYIDVAIFLIFCSILLPCFDRWRNIKRCRNETHSTKE